MRTVRKQKEDGASLVEFALIAPLLILLVLGIVEFAWIFGQNLSVNHGAREAARLTAVDFGNINAIHGEVCGRTDLIDNITLTLTGIDADGSGSIEVGEEVQATVSVEPTSLTNLLGGLAPDTLTSTVAIRVEQPPSWADGTIDGSITPCP